MHNKGDAIKGGNFALNLYRDIQDQLTRKAQYVFYDRKYNIGKF